MLSVNSPCESNLKTVAHATFHCFVQLTQYGGQALLLLRSTDRLTQACNFNSFYRRRTNEAFGATMPRPMTSWVALYPDDIMSGWHCDVSLLTDS